MVIASSLAPRLGGRRLGVQLLDEGRDAALQLCVVECLLGV